MTLASRMESRGIPGRIQVTKSTVEASNDSCEFDRRGIIEHKGRREVETSSLGRTLRRPSLRKINPFGKKGHRRERLFRNTTRLQLSSPNNTVRKCSTSVVMTHPYMEEDLHVAY